MEQLYDLVSQTALLFGEMIKNILVAGGRNRVESYEGGDGKKETRQ